MDPEQFRKLTVGCALLAGLISGQAIAQGWASFVQSLPISELTKQFGQGVAYIVDQIKDSNDRRRSDSVGRLVLDLADLAGSEEALADLIGVLAVNPSDAHVSPGPQGNRVMDSLNGHLSVIREKFAKVNEDLTGLNPQWAKSNSSLQIDIGSFAHDGALFYCISSCGTDFYTGQPAIVLTSQQQTTQLAAVLHSDVEKIRKIAAAIQAANTPAH